jgi:DNA transposition AAA+ family ATPase
MNERGIQKTLEQDARLIKERILMAAHHEKIQAVAADLKAFLNVHNWTQAAVAAKLGISTAVINQFLQGKYKGSHDELINKIVNLLNSLARKERQVKNKAFIETTVAKKIHTLITQTEAFSDDEGKIGLIIGDGGHGKSHCLREYARANRNTVYVELDDAMNPTTMFNEIAEKLGVLENGSLAVITRRLIEHLQNRHIIVILDEAAGLRVKQLNQLRQIIVVKCRCPLILAGNCDLLKTIMQPTTRRGHESLDQFTSRLMYILNLDEAASNKDSGLYTPEDVRKLYEYGGIRLTSDAIKTLRKICKTPRSGRLRTCSHLIAALHTANIVNKTGQIDSECIIAAIEELDLPVRTRLPLATKDIEEVEEEQKAIAKAG